MGLLRFLLATLVLVSHLGHTVFGLNPGVASVVVFYLLAGQVVAGLWEKWSPAPGALPRFYADRLWRVLPQYYAALIVSAVLWMGGGVVSPFLSLQPDLPAWGANVGVVPLAYYMYTGLEGFTLVPPAWSLGVELQFYLLAPLLFVRSAALGVGMAASGLVFIAAQAGLLNTDHFGYRLLPGILFVFLAGAMMRKPGARPWLLALAVLSAAYAGGLLLYGRHIPYDREVAVGLAIGLPLLLALRRLTLPAPLVALDRGLADLSYGVFVWHFPAIWILGLQPPALEGTAFACVFALSVFAAALTHVFVEKPLWRRWRHMVNGQNRPASS